ncbi:MAG: ABC transporter permease [Anaerolineae bacterium]
MSQAETALSQPAVRVRSQRQRMWRTFLQNRLTIVGLILIILIIFTAVFAPVLAPYDPTEQDTRNRLAPPSREHPMGLDSFGRDILSRIIYGARVSLLTGITSVLIGGTLGVLMGLVAGYVGGGVENFLMRAVDVLMACPSLIMALMVLAVLGAGLGKMILAIGIVLSPTFARVGHSATLAIKENEYVEVARSLGAGRLRIIRTHILPNILGEIVVLASIWTATAIRVEANLSFIGLGVSPPTPAWGSMIREGTNHLLQAPWVSIFPGLAILITVLAFNLVGDGLRDILDPKLQQ